MKTITSILSSSLGNILEWYDFGLFSIYASLFSQIFFPTTNPHMSLIATVGIFAIGFLCRPIGGLIFGYFGDRIGRVITLRISMLMIAIPTLLIGLLPTYDQIGLLAPILLTLIRMWQGISIGGEYSGNLIYLAEIAPPQFRATFISFASTGANIGILLATLVGYLTSQYITETRLLDWGWRVPYLLSGLICIFIYWLRLHMQETIVFINLREKKLIAKNPIAVVLRNNMPELLQTVGMVCMGSTFYYFCFTYLPIFLRESLNYSVSAVSSLFSLLFFLMLFLVPLSGYLCDRVGRKKMFLFNSFFIILAVLFSFYYIQQGIYILPLLLILTLASSLEQPTTSINVVENYPHVARYTGIAFGYNLGNGLLGGTVPVVCAWLAQSIAPFAPAVYIAFCAFISGMIVLCSVKITDIRNHA